MTLYYFYISIWFTNVAVFAWVEGLLKQYIHIYKVEVRSTYTPPSLDLIYKNILGILLLLLSSNIQFSLNNIHQYCFVKFDFSHVKKSFSIFLLLIVKGSGMKPSKDALRVPSSWCLQCISKLRKSKYSKWHKIWLWCTKYSENFNIYFLFAQQKKKMLWEKVIKVKGKLVGCTNRVKAY